ncbi:MAG: hypothetical protein R2681_05025 [Pyrinomonadaceae bacterium]
MIRSLVTDADDHVNVLDAFLVSLGADRPTAESEDNQPRIAKVFVNDKNVKELLMPRLNELANPIAMDLSPFLSRVKTA